MSLKEDAMESLKAMTPGPAVKGPPSPVQTMLGGISAGVIALILYKFTITIESGLNRQPLSDSFSVGLSNFTLFVNCIHCICFVSISVVSRQLKLYTITN